MAGLASIALMTGLVAVGPPSAAAAVMMQTDAETADVEQQLLDDLAAEDETTFWVYLREQADLEGAASIADRGDQGWFVYNQLTETAEESQANLVELLEDEEAVYEAFWITNTVQVTGDAELLDQITALPEVAEVTADRTYPLIEPEPADDQPRVQSTEWNIDRVNAPQVWSEFGATGEGIVVGTIDSGAVYAHDALVGQYRGNNGDGTFDHEYNWWDPSSICPSLEPCDNTGHGTHVTGTILGDDGGDNQIGMAPDAQWIAAKGCESNNCSQNALLSSGQFILAPSDFDGENRNPELRPHIVNNSWGGGATADPWYQPTVTAWVEAGIFPQFASGNPGSACGAAGNPGNLAESYAAGAFDINDNLYASSGRGPSAWGGDIIKPNIAAPGVAVRSAWNDGGYNAATGTSMASPHVAGAVALMWSAAPALVRDIDGTRTILDGTAEDTEDLACGGTPENNNVWGQGKLDAYAAVQQSPVGATGTLAGTVTAADTDDPIAGATITISGGFDRELVTDDAGSYETLLPVGEFQITASAFGYETASADPTITEDQTTTEDFSLQTVDSVTVSGTVTDGSGHGWPVYASVNVDGVPVDTYTDPATGEYSVTLPVNVAYTLEVEPEYPGYTADSATVEVGDSDVVHDVELLVETVRCREAVGYELAQPAMAMVTSLPAQFQAYFDERGIDVDFYPVAQLDQVTGYDLVLWGYNSTSVSEQVFSDFLDTTDADSTGVMFLDHAFTTWNGIRTLSNLTGNPETAGFTSAGGAGQETYYQVTQAHPILDGFEIGQEIIVEPGLAAWIAWFDGYEGDDREVIADVGRASDGIMGAGIGVQERASNRHVLLSMNSQTAGRGPNDWSDASEQIFWNAIDWTSPADASFECIAIEGGLVLGQVSDLNTDDAVANATVASTEDADVSATSFATPADPALGDGFYWMFSPLTGSNEFVASAGNYAEVTQTVNVAADAANVADFALPAGQLTVDPTELHSEVRFGQSAAGSFTITNTGTAPAAVELFESGGGFEILGGPESTNGPRRATGDSGNSIESGATGESIELGDDLTLGTSGLDPGQRSVNTLATPAQGSETLTHSASQDVVSLNSVACSVTGTGLTRDNGYLRHFVLDDFDINGDFGVTNVSFGIETINGPPHPVTVNLFTMIDPDGAFDYPNFESIGSTDVTLDPVDLTVVDVPVEGTAPAGSTLVVEVETPDMVDAGGGLFVGSNPDGETAPTYLRSEPCGVTSPTPVEQLVPGQNMHWVLNVTGEVQGDLPWLELDPATATLDPGDSVTVTVSMDSDATDEQQPGTYTAGISIGNDTPYAVDSVSASMSVTPPNNWGKIAGTVTGIACDGAGSAVAGATVQVNGKRDQVTLTTGSEGDYAYWLPVNNNRLTVIVSASGFVPQTRDTSLSPRSTVTEDFTLQAICASATEGEVTLL
jgi:subtilisin family serine protease